MPGLIFNCDRVDYRQAHDDIVSQEEIPRPPDRRLLHCIPGDGGLHRCPMVLDVRKGCSCMAVRADQGLCDSDLVPSNAPAVQPRTGPPARNSPDSGVLSCRSPTSHHFERSNSPPKFCFLSLSIQRQSAPARGLVPRQKNRLDLGHTHLDAMRHRAGVLPHDLFIPSEDQKP